MRPSPLTPFAMPSLQHKVLFAEIVSTKQFSQEELSTFVSNLVNCEFIKPKELFRQETKGQIKYKPTEWKQRVKDLYENVLLIPKTHFTWNGTTFLIDKDNIIYHSTNHSELGIYDPETNEIEFI